MKRILTTVGGLTIAVIATIGLLATVGSTSPRPRPDGSWLDPVTVPDTGAGEMLVVVLGGVYPTREEAAGANEQMIFGDVAGYYVVPVAQFQGFEDEVGLPGDFALVSVFRTDVGAQEFAAFAQSLGYPASILPNRVRSLGGLYAGLGQEADPNGLGPLTHPVEASMP